MKKNENAIRIIEALGDTAAVARLFEISMASVAGWKKIGIPSARMFYLKAMHPEVLEGVDVDAAISRRNFTGAQAKKGRSVELLAG